MTQHKFRTTEHNNKISEALTGRDLSIEHRNKLKKVAQKPRKEQSVEHRENISKANIGVPKHTEESKLKISIATTRRIRTPEGIFNSAKEYAAIMNIARITVYKRIEKHNLSYYFID